MCRAATGVTMNDEIPGSLSALWELADELGHESLTDPLCIFEPVGLLLVRPLERWDYDCTPSNSLTFAQAGEDGIHFSLLTLEGGDPATAPVVMTVPSEAHDCNRIVAGDLDEFLAAGAISGWLTLGRLVDEPDETFERLATPDPDPWSEPEQLLASIRERLAIEPMPLTAKRYDELQLTFGPAVVVERGGDE